MKSKLLKGMLTFAVMALVSIPAFSMSWIQIGDGHYIDVDSVRPATEYGTYTFDTQYLGVNTPLEEINGQQVWTIRTNSFIDCRNAYGKTLTYTALDANNKVVTRGRNVQKQWLDIRTPGNRAYESYSFVCTDRYINNYPRYHRLWWY